MCRKHNTGREEEKRSPAPQVKALDADMAAQSTLLHRVAADAPAGLGLQVRPAAAPLSRGARI